MNKTMILAGAAALVAAAGFAAPEGAGKLVFADDFRNPGVFLERWTVRSGRPGTVVCKDGALRVPTGSVEWKGSLPREFIAEVTLVDCPAWAERPASNPPKWPNWAGISFDFGNFSVSGDGRTVMLYRLPGVKNTRGAYRSVAGFELGRPVRLRVERRLMASQMRYRFFVNDVYMSDYIAPDPRGLKDDKGNPCEKPFSLSTLNIPAQFSDVRIYEVMSANASPNTLINSSFEHDEDGLPTHVQFINAGFAWKRRPVDEYESAYLKTYRVDRSERHSGRQSLRAVVSGATDRLAFRPFGAGAAKGASGVFSLWMKATKAGLPVELRYGSAKRKVTLTDDWSRYEVVCPALPDPGPQSIASVNVQTAGWEGTVLWVDDWQTEFVVPPKDGFVEGRTYASPFRVSSTDAGRFAKKPVERREPVACTAPAKTAAEAALRGYPLKRGETLVLGRLDFYMDEPEARFRVWDETGALAEATLDVSKLPCGTNAVTVRAHGRTWPATVVKLPRTPGATQVNRFARAIVRDGRSLVFSGLCSTTKPMMWGERDGKYPQLDLLASRGFRFFQLAAWDKREQVLAAEQILRQGAEKGFLFHLWADRQYGRLPDLSEDEAWSRLAQPNVCAIQVLDEPELSLKSDEAAAYMRKAHARFPAGCVMMNIAMPGSLAKGYEQGLSDVFMIDNYLTNNHYGRTVDSIVSCVDVLRRARPGTPCWYFLVNDNMTLHYKNPSYGEQVAQSWGTICAGGTGLNWYIGFPSTEPTWRAIVDVNREVQELADDLLSEELCGEAGASEPAKRLRVLTRKRGGAVTVFACNIDAAPLKKVKFVLPPEARQNGTVEVLYENRTIPLKGGVFSDAFAGHSRHVYRIK